MSASQVIDAVQRSFSVLLLLAFAAGLAVPALEPPTWIPAPLLALVLFVACARITASDLEAVKLSEVVGFSLVRFGVVPLLLWSVFRWLQPSLAPAVLLLGLLPSGVTTTAITSILKGNPALALGTTILSTALAPLVIPVLLSGLAGTAVEVDARGLATTLVLLLVVPTALYFGVARHSRRVRAQLERWGSLASVVLICTIAFLVANGQRARILSDPSALIALYAGGAVFYAAMYGLGLAFGRRGSHRDRIGWALASGNNNIVLGLTLALLHLPEQAVAFLAWDLAWISGLSAIQPVLRRLGTGSERG